MILCVSFFFFESTYFRQFLYSVKNGKFSLKTEVFTDLVIYINLLSSAGKHLKQNTPCHAR